MADETAALRKTRVGKVVSDKMDKTPLYLRCSFTAARIKFTILTPGISTGYWKDKNRPSWLRSSGFKANKSFPSKVTEPFVTSKAGLPTNTDERVLFPEPLGPIIA